MDNIYDYLKADHEKVADLFKQFEKAETLNQKFDYISYLIKELLVHAEAESAIFYKALEKHYKSDEDAWHGEEEHLKIAKKIYEILDDVYLDKAWEDKILQLKKLVEHHVSEEEGKVFKHAKKVFNDDEAYILREKMHDMKERILTRIDNETDEIKHKFEKFIETH